MSKTLTWLMAGAALTLTAGVAFAHDPPEAARDAVRDGSHATGDMTSEVVSAGRELLGEFRHEVSGILDEARNELRDIVSEQAREIGRGARRTRRKLGM